MIAAGLTRVGVTKMRDVIEMLILSAMVAASAFASMLAFADQLKIVQV